MVFPLATKALANGYAVYREGPEAKRTLSLLVTGKTQRFFAILSLSDLDLVLIDSSLRVRALAIALSVIPFFAKTWSF